MWSLSVAAVVLASLFISPEQAEQLITQDATVLDARDKGYFFGHLPRAQAISWLDYRDGWGRTGRLPADVAKLARRLAALGVDDNRSVVIYGDAERGFGEEGRIAWMLTYLGHRHVYVLDGGIAAWRQQGRPLHQGFAKTAVSGSFHPAVQDRLRADKADVRAALSRPGAVVLDVRSLEEWQGATPYLEARGGHIPGARHLDWKTLLDAHGKLRSRADLSALLQPLGIALPASPNPTTPTATADPEIIVYCTGGVRSAQVWAGLRSLGLSHVRNYDGSFWEWASDRSLPVEAPPAAPPAPSKRSHP